MRRADILLWVLVILLAIFVIWLVATGKLQEVANLFAAGYLKFLQNIVKPLHK